MESTSQNTRISASSHDHESIHVNRSSLEQSSQDITSNSTPNINLASPSSSSSSSPKRLTPSTSEPTTSQAPIYPSRTFSSFPFSSNRSGTAPKISITTSIDSMISNHQNGNVGLSLVTRDLVASPIEDFILGSPLEGFM
ncbi:hypothetical protein BofuT4_P111840.1 [Botrytis cinerea T4]|uniref:Uncharacterized protein n=1 Tax=Botryotinia fuckeliana (strain T4) TaxID=999810 RepID=G2Y6B9_BOTF4|nr:hypothetical protein BofuT4_P111840.1 [Botrytis cinerea T4]